MSVLIKGMEMPKNGTYICVIETNMIWLIDNDSIIKFRAGEICEVPTPHGDLIDRDAYTAYCDEHWIPMNYDAVLSQPTIIESEEV